VPEAQRFGHRGLAELRFVRRGRSGALLPVRRGEWLPRAVARPEVVSSPLDP